MPDITVSVSVPLASELTLMLNEFKDAELARIAPLQYTDPEAYATQRAAIEATTPAQFIRRMLRDTAINHWRDRQARDLWAQLEADRQAQEAGF